MTRYQLLPQLSTLEYELLKSLIVQNGAIVPIEVDENNNTIDGHHRLKIYGELAITDYPKVTRQFNSETEKLAYVYKINEGRRHLSADQKREILKAKQALALELKKEGKTQEQIAGLLGVAQNTISVWLNGNKNTTIINDDNSSIDNRLYEDASLDKRNKTTPKIKQTILDMAAQGKTQEQIAAEVKLSQQGVGKIINKNRGDNQKKKDKAKKVRGRATVELSSAIEWLERQGQCDLLLTDPPYSTDINDINTFAQEWLPVALSHTKPTGRAYIFIGAYPQELLAYLSTAIPTQVLVWEYRNTLGPKPAKNYKQNWQAILYYQMPDAPKLNGENLKERFTVQRFNAPDARHGERYHTWEKPLELAELIIKQSTQAGDVIFDPFAGTGTFLLASAINKRTGLGCEQSKDMLKICQERGINVI